MPPHLQLALTGALPALGAMWYFDRLDAKRPEPASLRRKVAIIGGLSVIPIIIIALILDLVAGGAAPAASTYQGAAYHSFILAAAIEEACKIAVVYWVVWRRPEFDERMDGIVYATRAGLGFALVENVMYLLGTNEMGGFVVTWVLRALLAVPGHALWTGMLGYFAARRRFDHSGPGLLGGYLLAVLLHGGYDFALFVGVPLRAAGKDDLALALLAVPVAIVLVSALAMRAMARTALRLDDADDASRVFQ